MLTASATTKSGGQTSQKFKFALVSNTGYSGVANVSCGSCGGAVG